MKFEETQKEHRLIQDVRLPVMESFQSLQGEGFHAGKSAFFVRLAGCDVGCHWCDVKASWDATNHPGKSIAELQTEFQDKIHSEIIVVTGGEPLMYDLSLLTGSLKKPGKRLHLETSGVYPVSGRWDWITFSPKKFKDPMDEFYKISDELKVVIFHETDFKWAEDHALKMNKDARLFLQPEWSKKDKMMPLIAEYIKNNPKWRVSLQIHKYLDIP